MSRFVLTLLTGIAVTLSGIQASGGAPAADVGASPEEPAHIFYVAPNGSDANDGTADRPLATVAGARDAVREYKQDDPVGDILVYFRGGTYTLDETVVFGLQDSGSAEQTITYAAYPGERPVLSSGRPIYGWRQPQQPPVRLPAVAHDKIWVADVPHSLSFKSLYDGETMLPRARGATFAPTKEGTLNTVHFPEGALQDWPNLGDVELVIAPRHWMVNILPLASVDEANNVATTQVPGKYPLGTNRRRDAAWIENTIEVLDKPGEWVLNTQAGKVYYWPADGTPGNVRAPRLKQLILVEGDIDYDGPTDTPVTHLVFRGLTFTQADRDTYPADYRGRGMQHAWDLQDRGNALIRFRGVAHSVVEDSVFYNSGHNAIRCDLSCEHNRFSGNLVHDVGAAGIILAGYGAGTKDVNHDNVVTNNHIHHVGRHYPHAIALWVWQSGGNRIAHNLIHDVPYTGLAVSGRIRFDPTRPTAEAAGTIRWDEIEAVTDVPPAGWDVVDYDSYEQFLYGRDNVVEYNDISKVMTTFHDGNAIYVSGTARGNVIRRNYIHDIDSPTIHYAYRTDDHQYGTLFTENVIAGLAHGGGLAHKQRNDMTNNVIADLDDPPAYLRLILSPVDGSKLQHNVYYSTKAGQRILREGPSYRGPVPRLTETDSDFNTYYSTLDPGWGPGFLEPYQADGYELNSLSIDPMFYDPAEHDFRMRPGSLAAATGFMQIDPAVAGLTEDFPHAVPGDALDRLFVRSDEQFSSIRMSAGDTVSLDVSGRTDVGYVADLGDTTITYRTDDPAVATVDYAGVVSAVRDGSTEITVSATDGGVETTTSIVVTVGVDRAELQVLVSHAEALEAAATAGDDPGQYPYQDVKALRALISSAIDVLADTSAGQPTVDAEAARLAAGVAVFNGEVLSACDPERGYSLLTGAPATASDESADHPAGYATDRLATTSWQIPQSEEPAWLQVDLGRPVTIGRTAVQLTAEDAVTGYEIQYLDADGAWQSVHAGATPSFPTQHDEFGAVTTSSLRLVLKDAADDAGVVEFKAYGGLDDTSAAATYSDGNWQAHARPAGLPGGLRLPPGVPFAGTFDNTIHRSDHPGATASFSFTGDGVELRTSTGPDQGIARVSVDGGEPVLVDLYRAGAGRDEPVYQRQDLALGSHTVTVEVTGQHHKDSTDPWVTVDRLIPLTSPTSGILPDGRIVYDDAGSECGQGSKIRYSGQWRSGAWDGAYNGTRHYSSRRGDYAELTFEGTGVALMTQLRPGHGIAAVSVDGGVPELVDTYSPAAQERVLAWERTGLSPGEHTVRVEVTGRRNAASSNRWVVIDAVVARP